MRSWIDDWLPEDEECRRTTGRGSLAGTWPFSNLTEDLDQVGAVRRWQGDRA